MPTRQHELQLHCGDLEERSQGSLGRKPELEVPCSKSGTEPSAKRFSGPCCTLMTACGTLYARMKAKWGRGGGESAFSVNQIKNLIWSEKQQSVVTDFLPLKIILNGMAVRR